MDRHVRKFVFLGNSYAPTSPARPSCTLSTLGLTRCRLRGDHILGNCRRWVEWCREKGQAGEGCRQGLQGVAADRHLHPGPTAHAAATAGSP